MLRGHTHEDVDSIAGRGFKAMLMGHTHEDVDSIAGRGEGLQ